jgi:hypothetical protein
MSNSLADSIYKGIEQLKSMEAPPQYRSRTLSFDEMAEIFADSGSAMFKEYIKIREKEKKEGLKNDYTK